MARFSGRVIVPNVAIGAAVLVRPSSVRSAQRRGDGVGVGIVLHHDEHALGVVEVRAYALDARAGHGPLQRRLQHGGGHRRGRQRYQGLGAGRSGLGEDHEWR